MSDERKDKKLIDELENYEYSMRDDGDEEFAEILKQAQERLKQLIQQQPEIDEKYVKEKARELYNKNREEYPHLQKVEFWEKAITQIISDVRGGKVEVDMNFLIMWQKKISKGSGGGHISLRLMRKMLEAIGAKFK